MPEALLQDHRQALAKPPFRRFLLVFVRGCDRLWAWCMPLARVFAIIYLPLRRCIPGPDVLRRAPGPEGFTTAARRRRRPEVPGNSIILLLRLEQVLLVRVCARSAAGRELREQPHLSDGRPGVRVAGDEVVGLGSVGGDVGLGDLDGAGGVVRVDDVVPGGQDLDVEDGLDAVDDVVLVDLAVDLLVGDVVLVGLDELVGHGCARCMCVSALVLIHTMERGLGR